MHSRFDLIVPHWAKYDELKFVSQAYRANPVVYRSVEYLAQSVSTATLLAWRAGREVETKLSDRHPMSLLLLRPSREYETQTRFIRQVIRRLCLSGEAIIYKVTEGPGRVTEMQLLQSSQITVIPDSFGIKRFDYRPDGMGEPIPLNPEDIIFLKFDDPLDPFRGLSPLAAAWREAQTDTSIGDYRKSFFDNAAIPSGVLTTKMDASRQKLQEWSSDWQDKYSGYRNAGKTPALAGGLEYQKTGATPGEIDFSDVVAIPEIRIPMVFGVGPILINAKAGLDRSSYTNYEAARVTFWQDTASPLMALIQDDMTIGLTTEADNFFIRFDTSEVPALQEDISKRETRAVSSLRNGAITINEYRQIIGLNPVEDGEVFLIPSNSVRVPAGELDEIPDPIEEAAAMAEATNVGEPSTPGTNDDKKDGDVPPNQQKPAAVGSGRTQEAEHLDRALEEAVVDVLAEGPSDETIRVARAAGAIRKALGIYAKSRGVEGDDLLDFLDRETLRLANDLVDPGGAFTRLGPEEWKEWVLFDLEERTGRNHVG
jgi:HK97 family phage portal protein